MNGNSCAALRQTRVGWVFPLTYSQEGLPFADGLQGFLVWGGPGLLNVTVGRADLWDHRGGFVWTERHSYANIRDHLQARDGKGLLALFADKAAEGEPVYPYMLPLGHVAFDLGEWAPAVGTLDPFTGLGEIELARGGRRAAVRLALAGGGLSVCWPEGLSPAGRAVPSWEHEPVRDALSKLGFEAPRPWGGGAEGGFSWNLPADPSVSLSFATDGGATFIASSRGGAARAAAPGFDAARDASQRHWRDWWAGAAKVSVPDADLQEVYDYGMYRFGAMTDPSGVPATLQGPWFEECKLPPWAGDYHFNINVEMCYWPAYHGNKAGNLLPLFRMVRGWWPALRENARKLCGVEDGFMMPHSVDDRGSVIGGYWGGTIDHGCTAWVAQMMFRYVLYTGDEAFLRSDAFPFMKGAMKVYRAMMEERGGRLSLAATTSPEWWGDGLPDDCWGRDASFQLAACHRLCRDLVRAAEMLGEAPDPMWLDVERRLPQYSVARQTSCVRRTDEEIGLFEGRRLGESHRHHSHMAGLVPFDTIDFDADGRTRDLVRETFTTWMQFGPGLWAGWSMPWASMLEAHIGEAEKAAHTLKTWKEFFNNPGHGSRHNAYFPGFSLLGRAPFDPPGDGAREIMQMDGAMAAVAAVQHLLCHERAGAVRLFAGAPAKWGRVSFSGFLVEGGFLVSATREGGALADLTVAAPRGGVFRWADPATGEIRSRAFAAGETRRLAGRAGD